METIFTELFLNQRYVNKQGFICRRFFTDRSRKYTRVSQNLLNDVCMKVPDGADVPLEEAEAPAVQGDPATQPVLAHFYYRAIDHSALKMRSINQLRNTKSQLI